MAGAPCRGASHELRPRHLPGDSNHLTYGLAVFYWLSEGRPARMDADGKSRSR